MLTPPAVPPYSPTQKLDGMAKKLTLLPGFVLSPWLSPELARDGWLDVQNATVQALLAD